MAYLRAIQGWDFMAVSRFSCAAKALKQMISCSSYEPVTRREFLEQIYAHVHPTDLGARDLLTIHPHRLSVLFMICAMATLLDTSKETPIPEAEEWHTLAKASVSLHSITDEPTIMGVQTLVCTDIRHKNT
jgi:hypothetical protein